MQGTREQLQAPFFVSQVSVCADILFIFLNSYILPKSSIQIAFWKFGETATENQVKGYEISKDSCIRR